MHLYVKPPDGHVEVSAPVNLKLSYFVPCLKE